MINVKCDESYSNSIRGQACRLHLLVLKSLKNLGKFTQYYYQVLQLVSHFLQKAIRMDAPEIARPNRPSVIPHWGVNTLRPLVMCILLTGNPISDAVARRAPAICSPMLFQISRGGFSLESRDGSRPLVKCILLTVSDAVARRAPAICSPMLFQISRGGFSLEPRDGLIVMLVLLDAAGSSCGWRRVRNQKRST